MLNDPAIVYTTTPQNVMKYVDFMAKIGVDQGQARVVEGPVLPQRPRLAWKLTRDERAGAGELSPTSRRSRGDTRRACADRVHVHRTPVLTSRVARRRGRRAAFLQVRESAEGRRVQGARRMQRGVLAVGR